MSSIPFKPATFKEPTFNCPCCRAFAHQNWVQSNFSGTPDGRLHKARCSSCNKSSYWLDEKMLYPDNGDFPPANNDLGEDITTDYLEAASISTKSPRGAAALLRLCIQKLCAQLGESGKNINSDIGSLVKKGLDPKIQKMLDVVRVVGNEAVHPGQIDLNDDPKIVVILAKLINEIANEMITKPREIEELYKTLPEDKLKAIEDRDKK